MSDGQIVTFIDIRARNTATQEFRNVSIEARRAGREIAQSFEGPALNSIRGIVMELRSFAYGLGLIAIARATIVPLVRSWLEIRKATEEARIEMEAYFRARNAGGSLTAQWKEFVAQVAGSASDVSLTSPIRQQATQVALLADQYGITTGRARELFDVAQKMAKEVAGFRDAPVKAFEALAAAEDGSFRKLQEGTKLDIDSRQRLIGYLKLQEAAEVELALKRKEEGNFFVGPNREEAEAANRVAIASMKKQVADLKREAGEIPPLEPKDLQKKDREEAKDALREQRIEHQVWSEMAREDAKELREEIHLMTDATRGLGTAIFDTFASMVTGAARGREAFRNFAAELIRLIGRLISEFIALAIARALAGAGAATSVNAGGSFGGSAGAAAAHPVGGLGGVGGSQFPGPSGAGPLSFPGSLGGGGGPTVFNQFNIKAWDGKDVISTLQEHGDTIGAVMVDQNSRNKVVRRSFGTEGRLR